MRFIAELDKSKPTWFVAGNFSYTTQPELFNWLDNTRGQGYSVGYSDKNYGIVGIHFYNERDAILFTLRWA